MTNKKLKSKTFPVFVHIERAGGTTLHYILQGCIPGYLGLHPWYYWTNEYENGFRVQELKVLLKIAPWVRGIGGHTVKPYYEYENIIGKSVAYVTFIRDPVARYISHYNYQKKCMNINWTMQSFIAEKRFSNFQTVRIAGKPCLDTAIKILEKKFTFVGLIEDYVKSVQKMCSTLSIPCPTKESVLKKNSVKSHYEHNEKTLRKIKKENSLDIRLYNYVVKNIWPKYNLIDINPDIGGNILKIRRFYSIIINTPIRMCLEGILHKKYGLIRHPSKNT